MATIACSECSRTFRTGSGLAWHLAHIHQHTGASDVDTTEPAMDGEIEALSGRMDDLEESMGITSSLLAETSKIREQLGLDDHSGESIVDWEVRLSGRVERLETELAESKGLLRQVQSIDQRAVALERAISDLQVIVSALRDLVWTLDLSHKKNTMLDLAVASPSVERLKKARDAIRTVN